MKKSREYVSRGFTPPPPPEEEEAPAFAYTYSPPQAHPHALPRDYGMRGAVGAYEVSPLSASLPEFFKRLERNQHSDGDTDIIAQVLETMLGTERALIDSFSFDNGTLAITLVPTADRFAFSRRWGLRLRQALVSHFGHLTFRIQKSTSRA